MRILLVNDYAAPNGGAEVGLLTLRDGLRQRGHDARVFATRARPSGGTSFADYECLGTTSRLRTLLQTTNPFAAVELRRALDEFRPDVVHVRIFLTQLSPLILPVLANVPTLYHVVWYRPICPIGTKLLPDGTICASPAGNVCYRSGCLPLHDWAPLMLQMRLWRRWRPAFDLVVANSKAVKRRLLAEGIGPVQVVWNGVPVVPARPPLASPPTVAFAGRLVREKGADVLLDAFARVRHELPAARLLVAGDGPERRALGQSVIELGLAEHVTQLGNVPRADLEAALAPAWVQAVPSRWAEPFGLVAAESMMRGTAVVASRTGGLAEVVHDEGTGVLVPPGDTAALADALLRLLRDRDVAEAMGHEGREVALRTFGETRYVDRFVELYDSLIAKRSPVRG
jgi:glycosyltransferase involved in cell wall biosynthesis